MADVRPGLSPAAKRVLIALAALVLLVVTLRALHLPFTQPVTITTHGDPYLAQVVCERAIKQQLKSPATAEFSDEQRSDLGNGRFSVSGSVDAENSFGALLRQSYDCTVWFGSADNYRIETLELHQ